MEDKGVGGGKSFIAGEKYCLGIQLNQTLCLSADQQNRDLHICICKASDEAMFQKHTPGTCKNLLGILSAL